MSRAAFLALGLLTILAISGTAQATYFRPPSGVVALVEQVNTFPTPTGSFNSFINVTFRLSEDDPDSINGTFNYTAYVNTTTNAGNGNCSSGICTGWIPLNLTRGGPGGCSVQIGCVGQYNPVPTRPGWVGTVISITGPQPFNVVDYAFNITAWNGTTASSGESGPSCNVNVTANLNRSRSQCGNPVINGTTGVSALVTMLGTGKYDASTNTVSNTVVEARWNTSLDDPLNTTSGNWSYIWYEGTPDVALNATGCICAYDTTDANDANGIRFHHFDLPANPIPVSYQVVVEDPWTHQRSNRSCIASLSTQRLYDAGACGTMGGINGIPGSAGPSFPFLNVTGWQAVTGLSSDEVGLFLSGVLLFAFTIVAFYAGGPIVGIVVAILCVPMMYLLSLLGAWVVVAIFMAAALVFVLTLAKGGASS